MTDTEDYRDVLRTALARRRERNPQYSLRALARDLDVSPSRLSEVLRHRQRLSQGLAARVATALGLAPTERDYFLSLVVAESELVDEGTRHKASLKARSLKGAMRRYRTVNDDELRFIGDPLHGIVFEALDLGCAPMPPDEQEGYLARRLGTSAVLIRAALARLCRLGLVAREATGYQKQERNFATAAEVPSETLRAAHRHLLARAAPALDEQPVAKRAFHSLVMAVDSSRLDEAKARLASFVREFNDEFGADAERDAVYCLSAQFFALSKDLT